MIFLSSSVKWLKSGKSLDGAPFPASTTPAAAADAAKELGANDERRAEEIALFMSSKTPALNGINTDAVSPSKDDHSLIPFSIDYSSKRLTGLLYHSVILTIFAVEESRMTL